MRRESAVVYGVMLMRLHPAIAAAALFVCFVAPRPAMGDPKTEAAARAEFERGHSALAHHDYAMALAAFSRARELYPSSGSLYNIAMCEERLGKLVASRAHWGQLLGELKPGDEREADAKAHIDALARRTPTAKVLLPEGAPDGVRVTLDGAPVGPEKVGVAQPIDPGQHVLVVFAPGRAKRSTMVSVPEGARGFALRGELGAPEAGATAVALTPSGPSSPAAGRPANASPADPTQPPAPSQEGSADDNRATRLHALRPAAFVTGVAGVAIGLGAGALVLSKKGTIASDCDSSRHVCASQDGLDAVSAARTFSTVSTIGFVVGAIGFSSWFLLPSAPTSFTATAGPGLAVFDVRGSF